MSPSRSPRSNALSAPPLAGSPTINPMLVMGIVIVTWGMGPPISKLVTASPIVATMIRFGLAFPFLMALSAWRSQPVTKELLRATALPGLAFGINLIFVFAALQEASVAVLSTTVALQPALMLVIAGPLFGEYPSGRHIAWSAVGILGAAIVIVGAGSDVRASALGVGLALAALGAFSVYFVLTRIARSQHSVDPMQWMAGINLWAFVATLGPALLWVRGDELGEFGGLDWVWIAIVAYLSGALGHIAMSWVHGYIEAARSSLYLLAMHVVAVGLAWPIHDEPITLIQVIGAAVLLWSVAAVMRLPTEVRPARVLRPHTQ